MRGLNELLARVHVMPLQRARVGVVRAASTAGSTFRSDDKSAMESLTILRAMTLRVALTILALTLLTVCAEFGVGSVCLALSAVDLIRSFGMTLAAGF